MFLLPACVQGTVSLAWPCRVSVVPCLQRIARVPLTEVGATDAGQSQLLPEGDPPLM